MQSNEPYNEALLLSELAEGDENAFRFFFDKYSPRVNAYAIRLTHSEVLAEEIVQEIFANFWEQRAQAKQIENVEAWLITLARNAGSSMLRRMAHEKIIIRELTAERPETDLAPEHSLEWKQLHQKIHDAVSLLPPQQQKVWIMSRQEGVRQQQIASELGISVYTVKEYIKKAAASIRKNMLKFIFWGIPSFFIAIRLLLYKLF